MPCQDNSERGGAPVALAADEFSMPRNEPRCLWLDPSTAPQRFISRPARQRGQCPRRRPGMRRTARATRAGPSGDDDGPGEPERPRAGS
jgi:hypothetical protein